jgi:hypothetical protein
MTQEKKEYVQTPGFGSMFPFENKNGTETAPQFTGKVTFTPELLAMAQKDGELQISAWNRTSKGGLEYLNLALKEVFKPNPEYKAKSEKKDLLDL